MLFGAGVLTRPLVFVTNYWHYSNHETFEIWGVLLVFTFQLNMQQLLCSLGNQTVRLQRSVYCCVCQRRPWIFHEQYFLSEYCRVFLISLRVLWLSYVAIQSCEIVEHCCRSHMHTFIDNWYFIVNTSYVYMHICNKYILYYMDIRNLKIRLHYFLTVQQ